MNYYYTSPHLDSPFRAPFFISSFSRFFREWAADSRQQNNKMIPRSHPGRLHLGIVASGPTASFSRAVQT